MPRRTVSTRQRVQVEVLRQVASDALFAVPEGEVGWTLAPVSIRVGHLVALATVALIGAALVVLLAGAAHALGPVEAGGLLGTLLTFLVFKVVDLPVGTVLAPLALHVEVLGEVADDAVETVPVLPLGTDTLTLSFVVGLTPGAVLTVLVAGVEVGWLNAHCALVPVEVGLVGRTVHAHLLLVVEHLPVRTVPALQCVVVEETRNVTPNALLAVPVELLGTPALSVHDHSAPFARGTIADVLVPDGSIRALRTLAAVKVGDVVGAGHTPLPSNVVHVIFTANEALLEHQVEVVRENTLNAPLPVKEELRVAADALLGLLVIDSISRTQLALEGSTVVELLPEAGPASTAFEEGLFRRARLARVGFQVVDEVFRT